MINVWYRCPHQKRYGNPPEILKTPNSRRQSKYTWILDTCWANLNNHSYVLFEILAQEVPISHKTSKHFWMLSLFSTICCIMLARNTAQKMKFSIKDFFSKYNIRFSFIFCAVKPIILLKPSTFCAMFEELYLDTQPGYILF